MAQIPDMTFKVKTTGRGGTERLTTAIQNAKANLVALQESMYEVHEAMNALEFVVERVKPEETSTDEGTR